MHSRIDPARFLRRTLALDALVCGLCGMALLSAPAAVATRIGLGSPGIPAVLGATLVFYALALARAVRGESLARRDAIVPLALNVLWLMGTAAVVAAGWLNARGNRVLLLAADIVVVITILEGIGLYRLTGGAARTPEAPA